MMRLRNLLLDRIRPVERALSDGLFLFLLLALTIALGWLAARHDHYWDWSSAGANSLSPESRQVLAQLDQPLRVSVFADQNSQTGKAIGRFLARYQQVYPALNIDYLDPQRFPEQAREAEVSLIGQLLLEYHGRRETLSVIDERTLTAAIVRLMAQRNPWIAVIEGQGERRIDGAGQGDLGRLGTLLQDQGFLARPLDLAMAADIPINTHLVILTTPTIPPFPGEIERLIEYLDRGGNLLWLMDPGGVAGFEQLLKAFGIETLPGTVVETGISDVCFQNPACVSIDQYPEHPLTVGLKAPAVLPGTLAFEPQVAAGWTLAAVLESRATSWNETGRIDGAIYRDEVIGEQAGPLSLALALTRPLSSPVNEQRVMIVGDGDFMSNAWLGVQGNRALAMAMLRWLSDSSDLFDLPPQRQPIPSLALDEQRRWLLGIGSLVLLPGLFLGTGLIVRWLRWSRH